MHIRYIHRIIGVIQVMFFSIPVKKLSGGILFFFVGKLILKLNILYAKYPKESSIVMWIFSNRYFFEIKNIIILLRKNNIIKQIIKNIDLLHIFSKIIIKLFVL